MYVRLSSLTGFFWFQGNNGVNCSVQSFVYLASPAGRLGSQGSYPSRELLSIFFQIVDQEVLVKEDYFLGTESLADSPQPAEDMVKESVEDG